MRGRGVARGSLFQVTEKRTLKRRYTNAILERDFSTFNIADGSRQMSMVGNRLHLSQIARGSIEGSEDTGPDR